MKTNEKNALPVHRVVNGAGVVIGWSVLNVEKTRVLAEFKTAEAACKFSECNADETPSTIGACKAGEYIRLKSGGPVWVRGDYDRSTKKYCLYKFDDVNHCAYKAGKTAVYVGFDF